VAEPFVDGGDVDGGFVADGQLVVAGGDRPVALEPVDAAFDGVTLLVDRGVERGIRSACSGMVAAMPWRRSQPRFAREP
jgi:hypothetical protein